MKRKRTTRIVAVRWESNPLHELAKLKQKELNCSYDMAMKFVQMKQEIIKL